MRLVVVSLITLPVAVAGFGIIAAATFLDSTESADTTSETVMEDSSTVGVSWPDIDDDEVGRTERYGDSGTAIEGSRPHLTVRDGASAITLPGAIPVLLTALPSPPIDLPPLADSATAPGAADGPGRGSGSGSDPSAGHRTDSGSDTDLDADAEPGSDSSSAPRPGQDPIGVPITPSIGNDGQLTGMPFDPVERPDPPMIMEVPSGPILGDKVDSPATIVSEPTSPSVEPTTGTTPDTGTADPKTDDPDPDTPAIQR